MSSYTDNNDNSANEKTEERFTPEHYSVETNSKTEPSSSEISDSPETGNNTPDYPLESAGEINGINISEDDHEDSEEKVNSSGFFDNDRKESNAEFVKYRPAGLFSRGLSYLIDIIVIYALTGIFIGGTTVSGSSLWMLSMSTIGIIGSLYFLLTTFFFRQTIGKMIFGIEVVGIDGKKPDFVSLIFREVVGRLISQLGGLHIGYLWGAFHPRMQTWHDILGDTYVVYKKGEEREKYILIEQKTS